MFITSVSVHLIVGAESLALSLFFFSGARTASVLEDSGFLLSLGS